MLNPEQQQAVDHTSGPVLVLAGAGTGKTKTITARITNLLNKGFASPDQIIAVTFTNKAAREMTSRVYNAAGLRLSWSGTFHAMCCRILRENSERVGIDQNFIIFDEDEQRQVISGLRKIDRERATALIRIISSWKDKALSPNLVADLVPNTENERLALEIYPAYEERLRELNATDFGGIILNSLTLLENFPEVLTSYHQRLPYILVDEYQDINNAQYLWLKLLSKGNNNICCVGDDDQSIYGWRGAEIKNILRFQEDFPGALVIRLERNYRSTNHILNSASHLIGFNSSRLGKSIFAANGEEGEKVNLLRFYNNKDEANYIAAFFSLNPEAIGDAAILVRTSSQTQALEEALMRSSVPYKVVGGVKFLERKEVKDIVGYIRLVLNLDDDLAFNRIINLPRRGVGAVSLQKIHQRSLRDKVSYFVALECMLEDGEFGGKLKGALQDFVNLIHNLAKLDGSIREFTRAVIEESGYLLILKNAGDQDAINNLAELLELIEGFNNFAAFLEHVALVNETDSAYNSPSVNIMTLHAAKGLEFDYVFLPGWEEGTMPHQRSIFECKEEEERRLAYVGITRARKHLFISCAQYRYRYSIGWEATAISRFFRELPANSTSIVRDTSTYSLKSYLAEAKLWA